LPFLKKRKDIYIMSHHHTPENTPVRTQEGTDQTLIAIVWKTALTIVISGIFAKVIGVF